MQDSSKSELRVSKLMTDLTSSKLDSSFKGSTQDFILEWQDKLREYENLTPVDAHFPNHLKKTMLENALQNVRCFREVKNNEELVTARGQEKITFDKYLSVVQNVAINNDQREMDFRMRRTQPRLVRYTEAHDNSRE